MPFKRFKAAHGGRGPFQEAYSAVTGGEGLFGRLGLNQERELTNKLIDDVSSSDEFRGLEGMLEIGRSPLTREQHAKFRAGITQAALDMRVFNAGIEEYAGRTAKARELAGANKEDLLLLDNFDALVGHAQRLAQTGNGAKAQEVFGSVLESFGQFVAKNEEQRLEVESAEAAGRETMRAELQGRLNSIASSALEDSALYGSLLEQIKDQPGADVAAPSLVSAVLEYAGAALRQSDDGNWSLGLGPIGISDTNLPAMTFSEIRNRLNQAYQGRARVLNGAGQTLITEATKRGMGVNGTNIDDLYFPLASQVFRQREQETRPPKLTDPEHASELSKRITDTVGNVGRGFLPSFVEGASRGLEWLLGTEPEPHMTPGDARPGNTRRGPGSVSGVIQRRPVND